MKAYEVIRNVCRPPRVRDFYSVTSSPRSRLRKSGLLEAWQAREITNFDFLMRLNFFAGRTYNDLSQCVIFPYCPSYRFVRLRLLCFERATCVCGRYPIFPWVLSDYTSDTLDLRDPRVYRNLGRPIAVQKDSRMEYFRKRYADSKRLCVAKVPLLLVLVGVVIRHTTMLNWITRVRNLGACIVAFSVSDTSKCRPQTRK